MKRVLLAGLLASAAAIAVAHTGATGIVKERMDGMGVLAQSMKALVGMRKAGDDDPARVAEIAHQIAGESGAVMTDRFPEGSIQHVSEAAPMIWQDWDRFVQLSADLKTVAQAIEADAVAGRVDLQASIDALNGACAACHKDFRVKK